MIVPKSHPRYESLLLREKITDCLKEGVISEAGIAAHGRGEAFDYFLGEKTTDEANKAIKAAAEMLCKAKNPVISVNGNIACLVPKEIVELSEIVPLKIEINLFYRTREREVKIKKRLEKYRAKEILGVGDDANEIIPGLDSLRGKVSREGIFSSDVVIVPLEDGDRALALKKMEKRIIAIDLNPLSRPSLCADITIVDNVVRVMPKLIEEIKKFKEKKIEENLEFDNRKNLKGSIKIMKKNLSSWEKKFNQR